MDAPEFPTVKHLAIYPIKSAAGLDVEAVHVAPGGVSVGEHMDHEYMVVRSEQNDQGIHEFITQRDKRRKDDVRQGLSVLAKIKPTLLEETLQLTWDGEDPISVSDYAVQGSELPVKIWDDTCYGVDQGDRIAEWLSDHLQLGVRLVRASGSFERATRQSYMANDNPLRFQDGYPVHWFGIESVAELSEIAQQDIPWQSFRPQIVTEGSPPQFEHLLYSGEIGGVPFVNPKPCDRCPVTTVDQETGVVRGSEPLKSLATYKRWRNNEGAMKVIFGENMLPLSQGTVRVGDPLMVSENRSPALVYGSKV